MSTGSSSPLPTAEEDITLRPGMPDDDPRCGIVVSASALSSVVASRVPHARTLFEDTSPFASEEPRRLVAERRGDVVGFVDFNPAIGYVKNLHVAPEHLGTGVGGMLLSAAETEIDGRTTLKAMAVNDTALGWYLRRGYGIVGGMLEDNWHGGPVVWIMLEKPGPQAA